MIYIKKIKKLFIQIYYTCIYYIPQFFRDIYILFKGDTISVKAFLDFSLGVWKKHNWGDDMNVYLCDLWFHKRLINYPTSVLSWLFKRKNYALVGSILQSANKKTIVWGSGLITDKEFPKEKPQKICAVRGPLSRQVLINNGISCPEVYGDPILLMPKFYSPRSVERKYKLGIIPHIFDEDNSLVQEFIRANPYTKLISMKNYADWRCVIDDIYSCEMIISSSLHGIILSDAYNVPNCWVEFSDKVLGNGFKFKDYFMSVHRSCSSPIRIMNMSDFQQVSNIKETYKNIDIDLKPLIASCPFILPFS